MAPALTPDNNGSVIRTLITHNRLLTTPRFFTNGNRHAHRLLNTLTHLHTHRNAMGTIFRKEFIAFFSSATGYVVLGLFWLALSLFMWVIPGNYNVIDTGYAQLNSLFSLTPWLFMLLCPAITMRMLAEEHQNHTWDWLQSLPVGTTRIVIGKYMASVTLSLIAITPFFLYYWAVGQLAEPVGNVDSGAFWGAMLGVIFLIAANTAVGLFASALSRSQLVSFIVGVVMCFVLFYGFDLASSFFSNGIVAEHISHAGFHYHYTSISRGVIDTRDLAYFILVSAIFCGLSVWGENKLAEHR